MKYKQIIQGKLKKRVNRFIAEVFIDGTVEQVHVKNTGRLKELLIPDVEVLLEVSDNPNRKTKYSLIAVNKKGNWVNIDSQAPNEVAFEALKEGKLVELGSVRTLKREVTFGDSRFDLYFEQEEHKGFMEVKGVTLEKNGFVTFPDAPTARGTKHVLELNKAVQAGYKGVILFVVQLKGCQAFTPNKDLDPSFADALIEASRNGVQILCYDSIVRENELVLNESIPVVL